MDESLEAPQERNPARSFLRQIARRRRSVDATERCELCSVELSPAHPHLLEKKSRQIVCSCDACAMVFCGQAGAHYLRVPRRIRWLTDFQLADLQWESLMIPINLAFFYQYESAGKMTAMYPSPAGAVESLLSLEAWEAIAADHPAVAGIEPDVEALLVNRVGMAHEFYIVPIDQCFRLVGIIRMHWRGLSGGVEVWKEVSAFFRDLKARATEVKEPVHA